MSEYSSNTKNNPHGFYKKDSTRSISFDSDLFNVYLFMNTTNNGFI